VRPYLLNIAVVEIDLSPPPIASTAFAVLDGFGSLEPRYLWAVLRSRYFVACVEDKMRGQAYPAINDFDFAQLPVPLPPREEQRRIVGRLDELLALCDQLEVSQKEEETQRVALRSATLRRLTSAGDQPTLHKYATFFLDTLPRFVKSPEDVAQVRQAVLDMAVQGRLVHQVAEDEPAASFLSRFSRVLEPATGDSSEVQLPTGWSSATIRQLSSMVTSGSRGWAEFYSPTGAAFIRAQNIRFGHLRLDDLAHVTLPSRHEGQRTRVNGGDIVIVITGAGVTNPALVDVEFDEAYVSQHVGLIRLLTRDIGPWLLLCLMAPSACREDLVSRAYGAGKPGLNLDNIRTLVAPVPPLAEQRRIVAKVHELMAVCDELEVRLTSAQDERGQLLESLLDEVLNGRTKPMAPAKMTVSVT